EPALEQAHHVGAGVALEAARFRVDAAELALGDVAVIAAQLLLGAQLHAVVGEFSLAALAVLAGTVFAVVDRALRAAPDILAHAAIDLVLRLMALRHRVLIVASLRSRPPLSRRGRNRQVLDRSDGQYRGSRNAARAAASAARGF